jgi:hypothetical protein
LAEDLRAFETAALRSIANAARLVQESPAPLDLRALQSVAARGAARAKRLDEG